MYTLMTRLIGTILFSVVSISCFAQNYSAEPYSADLVKQAESGDPKAQADLGYLYFFGVGVDKNEEEGIKWGLKAGEQGNAKAQYGLGQAYLNGSGVVKNEAEAVKWFTKSAKQGNCWSQVQLGVCFLKGIHVSKDEKEAVNWFTKAADQGDPGGQYNLGYCLYEGKGILKDTNKAVEYYKKAAEQGLSKAKKALTKLKNPSLTIHEDYSTELVEKAEAGDVKAQNALAHCYLCGKHGTPEDGSKAFKWSKESADKGDSGGQYILGCCFAEGIGVEKNDKEAVKLWIKAADQGDADGQIILGSCYSYGERGITKDEKKAFSFYMMAAEKGNPTALNNVGCCYAHGKGVEKDKKEAFKWWTKAAERGNRDAQNNLGWCYGNGIGVEKDDKESMKWYKEAAEQDQWSAQNALAWILSTSADPNIRNGNEAVQWAQKAIDNEGNSSVDILDTLAAAYAEKGDFLMAVTTQQNAIAKVKDENKSAIFKTHLDAYKANKAWRTNLEGSTVQSAPNPQ